MFKKILTLVLGALAVTGVAKADQEPIWDGNKVVMELKELGNNAYALIPSGASDMAQKGLPIATTSGFIVGEKAVLVIDTMLNQRLAKQVLALIKSKTDKPVRYVVNTSYHGDHSYGNDFFPEATTIIQHAATAAYISNNFKADTEFMMHILVKGAALKRSILVKPTSLFQQVGN
ncbi:MAG: MBL fold metallo-hydrolase [Sneathiella sp.]|nr:MBL fold metallo-hydrolase [Sneathiella sp.]